MLNNFDILTHAWKIQFIKQHLLHAYFLLVVQKGIMFDPPIKLCILKFGFINYDDDEKQPMNKIRKRFICCFSRIVSRDSINSVVMRVAFFFSRKDIDIWCINDTATLHKFALPILSIWNTQD